MVAKINQLNSHLIFGIATKSASNEDTNGDAYLIKNWANHVLVALIDGLGHGEEAAKASIQAKQYVTEHFSSPLEQIIQGIHDCLGKTRGAVVGLARIDQAEKRFAFCGVGNIEIKVTSYPPMHPTSLGGIVGMGKIRLKKFEYQYETLEAFSVYSDGISSKFEMPNNHPGLEPQKSAETILNIWGNKRDDATIILAIEKQKYR
jgi:negative regulator of sigma-B (phosphoserine phosphatase)